MNWVAIIALAVIFGSGVGLGFVLWGMGDVLEKCEGGHV